jgi:TonB-linked SusC/RagA family outer membrane protein
MNFLSGLHKPYPKWPVQTKRPHKPCWSSSINRIIMRINLAILLIIVTSMHLWATGNAQTINLQLKNVPLEEALKQIGKQTNYGYFFEKGTQTKGKNVNLSLRNATLKDALDQCFAKQPFTYELNNEMIVVKPKGIIEKITDFLKTITGRVTDENGQPLSGVSVNIKGGNRATITDADGNYKIEADEKSILIFSYVGYQTQEVPVSANNVVNISLRAVIGVLDDILVQGYGTTTQRLATGNIATIKAETIANQAGVTNPMQAIIGRVAGVQATPTGGMPGTQVNIQIRGRNSITANNEPLYIVDGVPFPSGALAGIVTSTSVSPLNSINPNDVESISILKDADATAIYGSRGSNGVILITTKKGQQGKLKVDANITNSYGTAIGLQPVMNTQEYLQLRRDAFANSGITPTATNAPDLISWDPNANTNPQDMYFGNTAKFWDGNFSFSGGNQGLTFLLTTGLHKEGTIRSSNDDYKRGNVHLNMNYNTPDGKFKLNFNGFYSTDKYYLILGSGSTPSTFAKAVPNYPYYDNNGNYNWIANQTNYLAQSNLYWRSATNNLNANFIASYEIIPHLIVKTSFGFNKADNDSMNLSPANAQRPGSISSGYFTSTNLSSVLFEPQITYSKQLNRNKIDFLIGSTLQSNNTKNRGTTITNIINDQLLESIQGGTVAYLNATTTLYRFSSLFGRLSYNYGDKYLLNATFRRDGSSRFGPGKQFGNFYGLSTGWLFTNEDFLKDNAVLSYGKLRASYGTTGSDGIGDYKYLNIYQSSTNYGTQPTIVPQQIANSDFQWEVNNKFEVGIELGFLKDRFLLTTSYFRNRSNNQLVRYPLTSITGFTDYTANLPAQVQNTGWEFEVNTKNISKGNFIWTTTANLTIPQNKLLSFPNIELTSYANTLIVGKSLSSVLRYQFLGIDPQTGLAQVADINGDNSFTNRSSYNNQGGDYIYAGYTNAKWFAGLGNTISYKNFALDFFLQYTKQDGYNLLNNSNGFNNFGQMMNAWQALSGYWRNPGDQVSIPKPMATSNSGTVAFSTSTATFTDASFLRLKNISFSYSLPQPVLKTLGLSNVKFYVQGLNTFTVSNYLGYDPERASSLSAGYPALKMWTFGLQATL